MNSLFNKSRLVLNKGPQYKASQLKLKKPNSINIEFGSQKKSY